MKKQEIYARYIKRLLDIICSALFLVVFCWLYAIVAVLVRIKLGSPVIFKHSRPGLNEKPFGMIKFRTMTDERDASGELLPDKDRLTRFGKILRATSLDELPEVWLIFTGKMSIVGPRPLLMKYLPLYNDFQHRRHEVKPGLTGYAQAYGRNSLTWDEKFEKDVYYVDHISFWLDVKILFKTVAVVFKKEGVNQAGKSATMEPFMGNEPIEVDGTVQNV